MSSYKIELSFGNDETKLSANYAGYDPYGDDCNNVGGVPTEVRQRYGLDYFYQKYTHAYGIPVLSSHLVRDDALRRACYVLRFMMADREDLRRAMFYNNGRVAVMADYPTEVTSSIPEHRQCCSHQDHTARGLGGTLHIPVSSVGEENLLCLPSDRYGNPGEDIMVHEFGHGIHHISAETVIHDFNSRLQQAYQSAIYRGLWSNTYAATNYIEYFAIGTQAYFDVANTGPPQGNGVHNHVNNRETLRSYDPSLYSLVKEIFPCGNRIIDRCHSQQGTLDSIPMNCDGNNPDPTKPPTDSTPNPPSDDCSDQNTNCAYWASIGECQNNPDYMLTYCKQSCGKCQSNCTDKNEHCASWASTGECQSNPAYMLEYCKKSCQVC